ncbi:MAG: RNase H family protein [Oligoflexus sp.]
MSSTYHLFCDASYHPKLGMGVGGYLILPQQDFDRQLKFPEQLRASIQIFKLTDTDNTSMEIITVLTALESYKTELEGNSSLQNSSPIVYTDCKTVCDLLDRREKLFARDFKSRKTDKFLSKHVLYRKFYAAFDELSPRIVWLKGHSPSKTHGDMQKIFSYVDRTVRRQLRADAKQSSG